MFVFGPEGSWCFPAGRSENLSGNFQLPALILTPTAPMKYMMMIIDVYPRTHTLVVTHAPHKAYDYTMGVADARLMT